MTETKNNNFHPKLLETIEPQFQDPIYNEYRVKFEEEGPNYPRLVVDLMGGVAIGASMSSAIIDYLVQNDIRPGLILCRSASMMPASMLQMGYCMDEIMKNITNFDMSWITNGCVGGLREKAYVNQAALRQHFVRYSLTGENTELNESGGVRIAALVTDQSSGKQKILASGNMFDALLATSALPMAFPPFRNGDEYLIDGELNKKIPYRQIVDLLENEELMVLRFKKPGISKSTKTIKAIQAIRNHWEKQTDEPIGRVLLKELDINSKPNIKAFEYNNKAGMYTLFKDVQQELEEYQVREVIQSIFNES